MTNVLVGAIGYLIGVLAHDLGVSALQEPKRLRAVAGICPDCGHRRGWTRLRCPECGRPVVREPVLAVFTGLTAIGFVATVGFGAVAIPYLGFLLLTTALIVTDLEAFRIVDDLNIPGTILLTLALGAVSVFSGDIGSFLRGLAGAAAYFGGASVVFVAVRGRGFGAGDVKLAAVLGLFCAYLSWGTLGWAVFATAMIGGALALMLVILGAAGMKTELPYGPPMILGAWTAIVMVGVGAIPIPS